MLSGSTSITYAAGRSQFCKHVGLGDLFVGSQVSLVYGDVLATVFEPVPEKDGNTHRLLAHPVGPGPDGRLRDVVDKLTSVGRASRLQRVFRRELVRLPLSS